MSHTNHTSITGRMQPERKPAGCRDFQFLNSDLRERQLADIGANNGEDAYEISASDAFKEFSAPLT